VNSSHLATSSHHIQVAPTSGSLEVRDIRRVRPFAKPLRCSNVSRNYEIPHQLASTAAGEASYLAQGGSNRDGGSRPRRNANSLSA
jgi:hypothetical protein